MDKTEWFWDIVLLPVSLSVILFVVCLEVVGVVFRRIKR